MSMYQSVWYPFFNSSKLLMCIPSLEPNAAVQTGINNPILLQFQRQLHPPKAWNTVLLLESRASRRSRLWHRLPWKVKCFSHLWALWMVLEGYREKILQFTTIAKRDVFNRVVHSEIRSSPQFMCPSNWLTSTSCMPWNHSNEEGGTPRQQWKVELSEKIPKWSLSQKKCWRKAPCSAWFTNQRLRKCLLNIFCMLKQLN